MLRYSILLMLVLSALLITCSSSEECSADIDCDDGDFCTENHCRFGRCSYVSVPYCCHSDNECDEEDRPRCEQDKDRCVQCLGDSDCDRYEELGRPRCNMHASWCVQCVEDADCGEGRFCDFTQGNVCEGGGLVPGQPCTDDGQCQTGPCLPEHTTGFPGGFCAKECSDHGQCGQGLCLDLGGGFKTCLPPCQSDDHCRPEYMCLPMAPGRAGCFPHCASDTHCQVVGQCNRWLGICGPEGSGNQNGEPCVADQDCKGFCVKEADSGAPGGVCVSICTAGRTQCPDAVESCVAPWSPFTFGQSICLPYIDLPPATCREYYVPMIAIDLGRQKLTGVCQPACRPGACQVGNCKPHSGLCSDEQPGTGETGDPCQVNAECRGLCLQYWNGGYCSGPCDPADSVCDPGSSCMNLGIHVSCALDCQTDQDCRDAEGYICDPQLKVCVFPP